MKNKLIYTGIIAAIFITAMIVYKDSLTLEALILIFIGAGGTIISVWKWLNTKAENAILKVMHKAEMRRNNLNLNDMNNYEILKGQAEWIRDYGDTHPEEAQEVLLQQIDNLDLLLKGDTINPTLTPPPPPPQ